MIIEIIDGKNSDDLIVNVGYCGGEPIDQERSLAQKAAMVLVKVLKSRSKNHTETMNGEPMTEEDAKLLEPK